MRLPENHMQVKIEFIFSKFNFQLFQYSFFVDWFSFGYPDPKIKMAIEAQDLKELVDALKSHPSLVEDEKKSYRNNFTKCVPQFKPSMKDCQLVRKHINDINIHVADLKKLGKSTDKYFDRLGRFFSVLWILGVISEGSSKKMANMLLRIIDRQYIVDADLVQKFFDMFEDGMEEQAEETYSSLIQKVFERDAQFKLELRLGLSIRVQDTRRDQPTDERPQKKARETLNTPCFFHLLKKCTVRNCRFSHYKISKPEAQKLKEKNPEKLKDLKLEDFE